MESLIHWPERNAETNAATRLRESLEESLASTVLKLELPVALRRFLLAAEAIENPIGAMRRMRRIIRNLTL